MKEFFSLENFGVQPLSAGPEYFDTKRAREILENTTTKDNERYETGLLWHYDSFVFPDSRPMAKRRLKCLEKKMGPDPKLAANLNQQS